ncbi:MAG: hypothetical protein A4E23_00209 [Methanomethylovorans sp. PtaU1.Bin073]|nr:MAG: hypothetical protein A4E23_00209 [Methanomethylovorans sp. PtaU1.Bin073]
MNKISPSVIRKINRLALRMIPLVPAPELLDIIEELSSSKKSISKKIEEAYISLKQTAELIDEIQHELTERTEMVDELKNEYEKYSKLAGIEEEKIKPLISELESVMRKDRKKQWIFDILTSLLVGLIIFVFGIIASPMITSWIGR